MRLRAASVSDRPPKPKFIAKANIHTIPGANHMPFWTHPNEFNAILKNILAKCFAFPTSKNHLDGASF
jgi:pimeloyl-ACP methyl ester carboxylesterase